MAINDGDGALVDGVQFGQAGQEGQKGRGGLGAHSIVFGKTPSETALVTLGGTVSGADRLFLSTINPGISNFTFRVTDKGTSILAPDTAKLAIDGKEVALTASPKKLDATDFSYLGATLLPPGSEHTYTIVVKDTNRGFKCYRTGVAPNKPTTFSLAARVTGGNLEITWTEAGVVLQQSTDLRLLG